MRRFMWVLCLGILCLTSGAPKGWGQSSGDPTLPYQRIFVPHSDLSQLVPNGFMPIKAQELEQLLRSSNPARGEWFQMPQLEKVRLVASLVGEDLISDASLYSIAYEDDVRSSILLSPTGLALRPCPSGILPDLERGVFASLVYTADGTPQLAIDGPTNLWFAWSLRPNKTEASRALDFQLQVPPCLDSSLLVRLPPGWKVESEQQVAWPTAQPMERLPASWPPIDRSGPGENWWILELGGASRIEFRLIRTEKVATPIHAWVINQQLIEQTIEPEGLQLRSTWSMDSQSASSQPLEVQLGFPLKVDSIQCDGQEAHWQQSDNRLLLYPLDSVSETDRDSRLPWRTQHWELFARGLHSSRPEGRESHSAEWELDSWNPLQIVNGYVLSGRTAVQVDERLEVRRMTTTENDPIISRAHPTSKEHWLWEWNWRETPPKMSVAVSPKSMPWKAESLLQLIPSGGTLRASISMQFAPIREGRAGLPFRLADGWTIESVTSNEPNLTFQISNEPDGESGYPLILRPSNPLIGDAIVIDIQLRQGIPQSNPDVLALSSYPLIAFRDVESLETVFIENGGPYSLKPSREVLNARLSEKQLPEWQQRRLPRLAEPWILRPTQGELPRLELQRQSPSFGTDCEIQIQTHPDGISVDYWLLVTPVSGGLQRVALRGAESLPENIVWSLEEASSFLPAGPQPRSFTSDRLTGSIRLESVVSSTITQGNVSSRQWLISLRRTMMEPFLLHGKWHASTRAELSVPLVVADRASRESLRVWVDETLDPRFELGSVRRLPPWSDATTDSIQPRIWLGVEGTCQPHHRVHVTATPPLLAQRAPVVFEEEIVDLALPNEPTQHWVRWDIDQWFQPMEWTLPSQWILVRYSVDDVWVDSEPSNASQTTRLTPVDTTRRRHRVLLQCRDRLRQQLGAGQAAYEWPAIDATIERASRMLVTPQGWRIRLAMHSTSPYASWPSVLTQQEPLNTLPFHGESKSIPVLSGLEVLPYPLQVVSLPSRFSVDVAPPQNTSANSKRAKILVKIEEEGRGHVRGWALAIFGFLLALMLHKPKAQPFLIGCGLAVGAICGFGLAIFPGSSPTLQPLGVGLLIGWIGRGVQDRLGRRTGNPISSRAAKGVVTGLLVFCLVLPSVVWGQEPATDLSTPASEHEIAHHPTAIILPIDSQGQLEGSMAYIAPQLYAKLLGLKVAEQPTNWFFKDADHTLNLLNDGSEQKVEVVQAYEMQIEQADRWVRIPYDTKQTILRKFYIDDVESPLSDRLRIDDTGLYWRPERSGAIRVRWVGEVKALEVEEGYSNVRLPCAVVPNANLEFTSATPILDFKIAAVGQTLNPARNRFLAHLGGLQEIDLRWRRREVSTPSSGAVQSPVVTTILDLNRARPMAWSRVSVPGEPFRPTGLEIEAPGDWIPLGNQWRDGLRMGLAGSSSGARRRYRVTFPAQQEDSAAGPRILELYWIPAADGANLLSIPLVDLVGVRGVKQRIAFSLPVNGLWRLEGGTATETTGDWLSELTPLPFEFTRLEKAMELTDVSTPPILRRSARSENSNLRVESRLHVRANTSELTWQANFGNGGEVGLLQPPSPLVISLPNGTQPKTIALNQQSTAWTYDPGEQRVLVFANSQSLLEGWKQVEMRCHVQNPKEASPIPLCLLSQDIFDYRLQVSTDQGMDVAIEGISAWNALPLTASEDDRSQVGHRMIGAWSIPRGLLQPREGEESPTWQLQKATEPQGMLAIHWSKGESEWTFSILGQTRDPGPAPSSLLLETTQSFANSWRSAEHTLVKSLPASNRAIVEIFPQRLPDGHWGFKLEQRWQPPSPTAWESPEIRFIGNETWEAYAVLPVLDESTWQLNLQGGSPIDRHQVPSPLVNAISDEAGSWFLLSKESWQLQAVPSGSPTLRLRCLSAQHELEPVGQRGRQGRGRSLFRLLPQSLDWAELEVPTGFQVLSVTVQGRRVEIRDPLAEVQPIPLFPNQSEVTVEAFWDYEPNEKELSVESMLPRMGNAESIEVSTSDRRPLSTASFPPIWEPKSWFRWDTLLSIHWVWLLGIPMMWLLRPTQSAQKLETGESPSAR